MNRTTRASRLLAWAPLFAVATGLCACSDATGSLVGGDSLSGSGTTTSDAGGGGGGGEGGGALQYFSTTGACAPNPGKDDTWAYLYGCYFGPSGVASCTFTAGGCHGGPSELGTQFTNGYICGSDPTACWQTMTSSGTVSASSDPTSTTLFTVLRTQATGEATLMPLAPTSVVFESGDMARIAAWIIAGAKND
jgi:hypothetical protein